MAWIYGYNHKRTHQGIRDPELGSILVPADRYYGRVDEVLNKVRAKLKGEKVSPYDYAKDIENIDPVNILNVREFKGDLEIEFIGRKYKLVYAV